MFSVGKFAKMIGVTSGTLRNWERDKKLIPLRTNGNQRRYTQEQYNQIMQIKQNERLNVGYCRVSAKHQQNDLVRQKEAMELYLAKQGVEYEILEDIGSGINYRKNGLKRVLELVSQNRVATLYILHKDRLVRFGFELIEEICKLHNTKIQIINQSEDKTDEQEMIEDIMNIIHVFSCQMNGKRSHINKKIIENLIKSTK